MITRVDERSGGATPPEKARPERPVRLGALTSVPAPRSQAHLRTARPTAFRLHGPTREAAS